MKLAVFLFSLCLIQVASSSELKRTSVSWQLGPESSSYNLDVGITKASSLGLHFQQQFDKREETSTTYVLQGLDNYGLNYEYFFSPNKHRFESGVVLTAGVHYTKLSAGSIHQEIIIENKQSIKSGEGFIGARLAASYRWYSDSIFVGAGTEVSKVGKAIAFLPVKIQFGIIF